MKTGLFGVLLFLACGIGASCGASHTSGDPDADQSADSGDADVTPLECEPPCPAGSECRDRDGVGAPECVLPTGELACAAPSHCPADAYCEEERCQQLCGCTSDEDCGQDDVICADEDEGCGLCFPQNDYACLDIAECRRVLDLAQCCHCPRARNAAALAADPCLVEYPFDGDPPAGCEPRCDGIDHCWPCDEERTILDCRGGACRLLWGD